MNVRLDSASVFDALSRQQGRWTLGEHEFDPTADEIRIAYDTGGRGRVALTISFELDQPAMDRLLSEARPVG